MSVDQLITIAILALTFALLIKSNIQPVAVFVGALTLTITFRLAPLGHSLKGFSDPGSDVYSGYPRSRENKSSAVPPALYSFEFCFNFRRNLYADRNINKPGGGRDGD